MRFLDCLSPTISEDCCVFAVEQDFEKRCLNKRACNSCCTLLQVKSHSSAARFLISTNCSSLLVFNYYLLRNYRCNKRAQQKMLTLVPELQNFKLGLIAEKQLPRCHTFVALLRLETRQFSLACLVFSSPFFASHILRNRVLKCWVRYCPLLF